jgi:hypothetical protein
MLFGQFTPNPNLRQTLKSGTYGKNLIVPKGVLVVGKNAVVKFKTGYGLIIKEGGTLYLENCIITHENDDFINPNKINKCGEYWNGIFVEGNPNASQDVQYRKSCNLLAACISLFYPGVDSFYGMNDCWNVDPTTHIQGLLYMKNTVIRRAVVGISLGDIRNNVSNRVDPAGPKGGGLLISKNCKFSNMHNAAISFAPYQKFPNLSKIEFDTFECASRVGYHSGGRKSMNGIIAAFNTFSFPIASNYFFRSNTSSWEFPTGIYFDDCYSSVNKNKFQNLTRAIFMFGGNVSLKKTIEVYGNIATDCNQMFTIWSMDIASVYDNRITVKDVGNVGLATRFAVGGTYSCKDITIRKNQLRPSNPNTVMNSIGITMGGYLSGGSVLPKPKIIHCYGNTVIGLANSFAHNEDSRGNIFDCNTFNSNISFVSSSYDVGHTSPYLPTFATSYGSSKNPLSNTFTSPVLNSTFKNIWSNTSSYNYIYNPVSSAFDPQTRSPILTKTPGWPRNNPCPAVYPVPLLVKEPCPPKIKPPIRLDSLIPQAMYGRKNLDTVGNDTWDFYVAKNKYMQLFQQNLQALSADYSDTFKTLYISKIDTLLETIPDSSDYYYYSAFHYLLHNDSTRWSNLKTEINPLLPLHSELNYLTDYIEILKTLSDNNFDSAYVLSIQNSLDTIKVSNGWVNQKASALYCYLYNQGCYDPMMNFGDTTNLQSGDSIVYNYSPNPFNANLTLTLTNNYTTTKSIQIDIAPFTSSTVLYNNSVSIPAGNTVTLNITTNTWPTDYYALLLNYTGYYHSDILYKP